MIHWKSSESHLLANPSYAKKELERFQKILHAGTNWKGHIWLSTSGSSAPKWVGLSKEALLSSAHAVNHHLHSDQNDIWVSTLPDFHVGGLGILARAHLSGAKVCDFKAAFPGKWNAAEFYRYLGEVNGTLTSLVPAQLADLVQMGKSPPSLRAVIIGGGFTPSSLYEKGISLGWPLLPSYGMTECASQVATAPLNSWKEGRDPLLSLLPHLEGDIRDGFLSFSGPSLLTTYAHITQDQVIFEDPKIDGWLKTQDRGAIENGMLRVFGRGDAIVKVGGENVDLSLLENHLQELKLQLGLPFEVCLLAMSDERLGSAIHLASEASSEEILAPLVSAFQNFVLPFERIRKVHLVAEFPRSSIGKVLKNQLVEMIGFKL